MPPTNQTCSFVSSESALTADLRVRDAIAELQKMDAPRQAWTSNDTRSTLSGVFQKLQKQEDCCISICLLGGSNACGSGHPGHPWRWAHEVNRSRVTKPSISTVYAEQLVHWMNFHSKRCCGRGHRLTNLCLGSAGTAYILETAMSKIDSKVDLFLIDT